MLVNRIVDKTAVHALNGWGMDGERYFRHVTGVLVKHEGELGDRLPGDAVWKDEYKSVL